MAGEISISSDKMDRSGNKDDGAGHVDLLLVARRTPRDPSDGNNQTCLLEAYHAMHELKFCPWTSEEKGCG
jgi:hypothetical protein